MTDIEKNTKDLEALRIMWLDAVAKNETEQRTDKLADSIDRLLDQRIELLNQ
jgi:hypothetical protein